MGLLSTTGDLEQSERDILTLRGQQGRCAERIALMQRLLKVVLHSTAPTLIIVAQIIESS